MLKFSYTFTLSAALLHLEPKSVGDSSSYSARLLVSHQNTTFESLKMETLKGLLTPFKWNLHRLKFQEVFACNAPIYLL